MDTTETQLILHKAHRIIWKAWLKDPCNKHLKKVLEGIDNAEWELIGMKLPR